MDDFETLLISDDAARDRIKNKKRQTKGTQQADKNATLFDFIKMIQKLVTLTMKDLKVEFIPDEGKKNLLDVEEKIDHPYITYKILHRIPKDEKKPRIRGSFIEDIKEENKERIGEVYGQKFKCLVQFNILANKFSLAEEVMEKFEDLMFMYTGYFKKNGVSEILFEKQNTDESYDIFRETISVRNLQYYVEVEKLTVVFEEKIKEIETHMGFDEEV